MQIQAFDKNLELATTERVSCRKIENEYYIQNEACIKMPNDSWHRINNGKIVYNPSLETYVFHNYNMIPVIYDFINGKFKVGFIENIENNVTFLELNPLNSIKGFASNPLSFIGEFTKYFYPIDIFYLENFFLKCYNVVKNNCSIYIYNSILKKVKEEIKIHVLNNYHLALDSKILNKFYKKKIIQHKQYSRELNYNFANSNSYYKINCKKGFDNLVIDKEELKLFNNIYDNYFNNKTFGVEIETHRGTIDENNLFKFGFIPLRDGSLEGGIEYTSLPYSNGKGLAAIYEFYKILQNQTEVASNCSFHIHFGGIERTKLFCLTLYRLCYRIQEEMFDLVPIYKKELRYWNSKQRPKDHCQSLKSLALDVANIKEDGIDVEFKKIFKFLSEGIDENSEYNFDNKNYPKVNSEKWNQESRYYWINLLPFVFGKNETVEFRIFESTLDPKISLYYILISLAIISYAEKHSAIVLNNKKKITLIDIINSVFKNPYATEITSFINTRRASNLEDFYTNNIYGEINRQNEENNITASEKEYLSEVSINNMRETVNNSKLYLNLYKDLNKNTEGNSLTIGNFFTIDNFELNTHAVPRFR